jgi:hypothetical protein
MSCKEPVSPEDGKVFLGVFVCPTCHQLVGRLRDRNLKELQHLVTILDEALRIALIEGKLLVAGDKKELSKREVLEQVLKLSEIADAHKTRAGADAGHPADQPQRPSPDGASVRPLGGPGVAGPAPRPVGIPGHRSSRDAVGSRGRPPRG